MLGRARVLGQPLNPMLTVLPLGIIGSAVLVDMGALISGSHLFGRMGHADLTVGLLAGVVSLSAILIDLLRSGRWCRRQALSLVAGLTGGMIATFMVIWSVRVDGDRSPNGLVFLLEVLALAAGVVGAWLVRRLALGYALPDRYEPAGMLAERYLVAGPVRAAGAIRRTVPLTRLMR